MFPLYVVRERIAKGLLIGTYRPMSPSGEFSVRAYRVGDEAIGVATRDLEVGDKFREVVPTENNRHPDISAHATIIQG